MLRGVLGWVGEVDRWERFERRIPTKQFGPGSVHDFQWYSTDQAQYHRAQLGLALHSSWGILYRIFAVLLKWLPADRARGPDLDVIAQSMDWRTLDDSSGDQLRYRPRIG